MDVLTAAAGVSTRTLYKHLGNKTGLMIAVLEARMQRFFDHCQARSVDDLFARLQDWVEDEGSRGCLFLRAQGEAGESTPEVAEVVAGYREKLRSMISQVVNDDLGRGTSTGENDTVATQILVLFEAGHSVDVLDLHAEGFDPRFTEADHSHFWGGEIPHGITDMHQRVEAADRLAFVFPVYWWSMPAMMKGWIERVFTGGWAYQYDSGVEDRGKEPLTGLLPRVPTARIGVGGSKQRTYDKYGYGEAVRTQLDIGIFAYCGITDVESHLIVDVEGEHNADNRVAGLDQAGDTAAAFASPARMPRNANDEHLNSRGIVSL